MMKSDMYIQPNPLIFFDQVSRLKKLLKPIKVRNSDSFIKKILDKPLEISNLITSNYKGNDFEYINVNCEIKCNIAISFHCRINGSTNAWIITEKPNGESFYIIDDVEIVLREVLKNIDLPEKIIFTEIDLNQKIKNVESAFSYKINL